MDKLDVRRLIEPDLQRLRATLPADALACYLSFCPGGATQDAEAKTALADLLGSRATESLLESAAGAPQLAREKNEIRLTQPDSPSRALASVKARLAHAREDLAWRALESDQPLPDMAAAALIRVFGLPLPLAARADEVRFALLRKLMSAAFPASSFGKPEAPRRFQMDAVSRQLYLAFAGLEKGTIQQAERAILRAAFNAKGRTFDLSGAIVRAAAKIEAMQPSRPEAPTSAPQPITVEAPAPTMPAAPGANGITVPDEGDGLEDHLTRFAEDVRRIARTLETRPYKGRVAIAQVYDAGVERGLALGTLDEFKALLAEAARESLLDLERYDIAGPLDSVLKERSRTPLGRDERHFIVNQWI